MLRSGSTGINVKPQAPGTSGDYFVPGTGIADLNTPLKEIPAHIQKEIKDKEEQAEIDVDVAEEAKIKEREPTKEEIEAIESGDLGFDIDLDGSFNMIVLPNPVPGMKVVYNGVIKTAQFTYEMLPKNLRNRVKN